MWTGLTGALEALGLLAAAWLAPGTAGVAQACSPGGPSYAVTSLTSPSPRAIRPRLGRK